MSDGFLGRWSRRKLEVRQGKEIEPEPVHATQPVPVPQPPSAGAGSNESGVSAASREVVPSSAQGEGGGERSAEAPPLTLEDVKALTAESDFSRFAASGVAPEVKNAAMKKLFTDPRYNVMDGLDVYTGDYSRPEPIAPAVLRKLASASFLGLFDEEEKQEEAARQARDVADNLTEQTVAKSSAVPAVPEVPELPEHADPDLRLQQDHAAPGKDPGRGTG